MAAPQDFNREVWSIVAAIPGGRVVTYGQIARLAGCPALARRVGRALHSAPASVPCHRVVDASGRLAPGWAGQRGLLQSEGVEVRASGRVDLRRYGWELLRDDSAGGQ